MKMHDQELKIVQTGPRGYQTARKI